MTTTDMERAREVVPRVLRLIAEGYPAHGEQDHYIVVENPDYQPDNGADPKIVLDVDLYEPQPSSSDDVRAQIIAALDKAADDAVSVETAVGYSRAADLVRAMPSPVSGEWDTDDPEQEGRGGDMGEDYAPEPPTTIVQALVALADGAELVSDRMHVVQPFFDIYKRHGAAIAQARALLAPSRPPEPSVSGEPVPLPRATRDEFAAIVDDWFGERLKAGHASSWHYGELLTKLRPVFAAALTHPPEGDVRKLRDMLRVGRQIVMQLVADYGDVPDPTDADGQWLFTHANEWLNALSALPVPDDETKRLRDALEQCSAPYVGDGPTRAVDAVKEISRRQDIAARALAGKPPVEETKP